MRTRVRGWRWRHNPLRRRSDVVEAWTTLAVVLLLLLVAPLAGALTARWAHSEAEAAAVSQRADRHSVRAEVVGEIPHKLPTVQGSRAHTFRTTVSWTEPGEGRPSGSTPSPWASAPRPGRSA
jgi:hypothetical protein